MVLVFLSLSHGLVRKIKLEDLVFTGHVKERVLSTFQNDISLQQCKISNFVNGFHLTESILVGDGQPLCLQTFRCFVSVYCHLVLAIIIDTYYKAVSVLIAILSAFSLKRDRNNFLNVFKIV